MNEAVEAGIPWAWLMIQVYGWGMWRAGRPDLPTVYGLDDDGGPLTPVSGDGPPY